MAAPATNQRPEAVQDLSTLSPVSDDIIVACLRERFMNDTIYTAIGTSAIVALNPHKYVHSSSDSVLQQYAAEYRNTDGDAIERKLSPHIFQLINSTYYHMRRTGQDQAVVFRSGYFYIITKMSR
jgi:chitin synthase